MEPGCPHPGSGARWPRREQSKSPGEIDLQYKETLVALILVGLHLGENELAGQSAKALGAICRLDYLDPLVSLAIEAREGHFLSALQHLNELRHSAQFSRHWQVILDQVQQVLEQQKDDGPLQEDAFRQIVLNLCQGILADVFDSETRNALLQKAQLATRQLPSSRSVDFLAAPEKSQ